MNDPYTVTVTGAVERSGMSRTRIYKLLREKKLRTVKLKGNKGRRMIYWESVKAYLDKHEQKI